MKYLLVHWSIRDGENEYDDYALVKTEKKTWNDVKVFKKVLVDNYGKGLMDNYGKGLKPTETTNNDRYVIPNDYRIAELEAVSEITEEERNALFSTRVVSWETDY